MKLIDYPQLYDVFPGVKIRGGLSYWVWARDHEGPCEITTMMGNDLVGTPVLRELDAYDVFVRRNEGVVILDKVSQYRVDGKPEQKLSQNVSARKPFGLTNERGAKSPDKISSPILVYGNQIQSYLPREKISNNEEWVDNWKVLLVKAHGTSGREDRTILGSPLVASPGSACTETYLVMGTYDNKEKADYLAFYLRTRFVRFLVSLRKITQNITRDTYKFVPQLPMDQEWTDQMLYERYGISADEVDFINSVIDERN